MKIRILLFTALIILSTSAFSQKPGPVITTFRLDGLIISKARLDSLKLDAAHILKIRSMPPAEAAGAFGQKANKGIGIISTSKMIVVVTALAETKAASSILEKETMLSKVEESQIKSMRNINAETLLTEFKMKHPQGAIVIYLK